MKISVKVPHEVTISDMELIHLLIQRRKEFLKGYDAIEERGGQYIPVKWGTGSHYHKDDEYGEPVSEQVYRQHQAFNTLINLLRWSE